MRVCWILSQHTLTAPPSFLGVQSLIQLEEVSVRVGEGCDLARCDFWNYVGADYVFALKIHVKDREALETFVHTERNELTPDLDILAMLMEDEYYTLERTKLQGEDVWVFREDYNDERHLVPEDSLSELMAEGSLVLMGVCLDG